MSRAEPPICQRVIPWIKHHRGAAVFAPFTGQDWRAFLAFAHLLELYSVSDNPGRRHAIDAMRATVQAMQAHVRDIALDAVPSVLDWPDRERIASAIGGHRE